MNLLGLTELYRVFMSFTRFHCFWGVLLGFTGFNWALPSFPVFFLGFTGLYWVIPGFTEFYWIILGYTGLYWILLGFTGFLLGFTRLDRVSPSVTGFYWVLFGFYWVLLGLTRFWLGFYWLLLSFTGFLITLCKVLGKPHFPILPHFPNWYLKPKLVKVLDSVMIYFHNKVLILSNDFWFLLWWPNSIKLPSWLVVGYECVCVCVCFSWSSANQRRPLEETFRGAAARVGGFRSRRRKSLVVTSAIERRATNFPRKAFVSRSHRVFLGFTAFYWVLPGFTGFYLVLLGFTGI